MDNFKDRNTSPSDHEPDVVLWLDHQYFKQNEATIDTLRRGDKIKFVGFISKLRLEEPPA